MEQNLPVVACKKVWNIVRVIYLMLRKGIISKGKLLSDLNTFMKRGKIAGKAAIHNLLMSHHHHVSASFPADEYEFSCSSSPAAFFHFPRFQRGGNKHPVDGKLVAATLEMMVGSAAASPALPGFGRTPMVRQLRITDSPFPLRPEAEEEGDHHLVDEAAEDFIVRFYKDLKRQNQMGFS